MLANWFHNRLILLGIVVVVIVIAAIFLFMPDNEDVDPRPALDTRNTELSFFYSTLGYSFNFPGDLTFEQPQQEYFVFFPLGGESTERVFYVDQRFGTESNLGKLEEQRMQIYEDVETQSLEGTLDGFWLQGMLRSDSLESDRSEIVQEVFVRIKDRVVKFSCQGEGCDRVDLKEIVSTIQVNE